MTSRQGLRPQSLDYEKREIHIVAVEAHQHENSRQATLEIQSLHATAEPGQTMGEIHSGIAGLNQSVASDAVKSI